MKQNANAIQSLRKAKDGHLYYQPLKLPPGLEPQEPIEAAIDYTGEVPKMDLQVEGSSAHVTLRRVRAGTPFRIIRVQHDGFRVLLLSGTYSPGQDLIVPVACGFNNYVAEIIHDTSLVIDRSVIQY